MARFSVVVQINRGNCNHDNRPIEHHLFYIYVGFPSSDTWIGAVIWDHTNENHETNRRRRQLLLLFFAYAAHFNRDSCTAKAATSPFRVALLSCIIRLHCKCGRACISTDRNFFFVSLSICLSFPPFRFPLSAGPFLLASHAIVIVLLPYASVFVLL